MTRPTEETDALSHSLMDVDLTGLLAHAVIPIIPFMKRQRVA
jgi:hypothetical protein